jgi:DNA-binding transcriptional ArsR family regulator
MSDNIKELANIFKALSDPTRLQLVVLLKGCNCEGNEKNLCVMALTKRLNVSQSAVSQHLRVLRQADLVEAKRIGNHVHYSINRKTMEKYREQIGKIL